MKQIYCLLVLTVFLCVKTFAVDAQSWDEKLGDKEFEKFNFQKAILYYQDAFEKDNSNDIARKLADCYRLLNNSADAEKWYLSAIELGNMDTDLQKYYADALRSNGKYEDAQYVLKQYLAANPDDKSAKEMFDQFDNINELLVDKGDFQIEKSGISSKFSEYSPVFYNDKVLFISDRNGGSSFVKQGESWTGEGFDQVWVADRKGDGSLENPRVFEEAGINGRFHEGPLTINKQTNTLYITRSNYDKKKTAEGENYINLKIYKKTLGADGDGKVEEFPFNSNEHTASHPTISEDGVILVFSGDQPGGEGETDLYYSTMQDGQWTTPKSIGAEINTNRREMFPFLAADNTLYFASDGHAGLGGLDIYKANFVNGQWTQVENLGVPVNSPKDDFGFAIDENSQHGYFSSNRDNPKHDDIYRFTAVSPIKCLISGVAKDAYTNEPMAGVKIKLSDQDGNMIAEKRVNREGTYKFQVEPGEEYILSSSMQDFLDEQYKLSFDEGCVVADVDEGNHEFIEELNDGDLAEKVINFGMRRDIPVVIYGTIQEKGSIKLVREAKVRITDLENGQVIYDGRTGPTGEFEQPIGKHAGQKVNYEVLLMKNGYAPKTIHINEKLDEPGSFRIKAELEEMVEGVDAGKLLNLKPILFDMNSTDIRNESAIELDKVIELMTEYPDLVIELGSHTDSRGSAGYNRSLSSERAKASKSYIISKGIDAKRIKSKGYGESKLLNDCGDNADCTEKQHQKNRRTEFLILKY